MPESAGILPEKFLQPDAMAGSALSVVERINISAPLDQILIFARNQNASDVHVCTNAPVMIRRFGVFTPATEETLTYIKNKSCGTINVTRFD